MTRQEDRNAKGWSEIDLSMGVLIAKQILVEWTVQEHSADKPASAKARTIILQALDVIEERHHARIEKLVSRKAVTNAKRESQ